MRNCHGVVLGALLLCGAVTTPAQQAGSPAGTTPDCSKLKGKALKSCQAAAATPPPAKAANPKDTPDDKFAFPEDASKNGGELQRNTRATGTAGATAGDMPTGGVPDPPAEFMKPMHPTDGDRSGDASSSSSSSSSGADAAPPDDDAAPTTAGSDTPVKASDLHDLGAPKVDSAQVHSRLEATRVEDDLKVGRFYFKDGNYAGATARYKDALSRDPENPDAHFGLAEVLAKQGKRAEAAAELKTYLQLAPDDDHTRDAQKMLAKLR